MERRNFIVSTIALAAIGSDLLAVNNESLNEKEAFLVRSGKARNDKHTPYRGSNPNDLKISSMDTAGQLSVFEYIGVDKIGPPLHVHLDQDEVFYVVEGEYRFQVGEERHELKTGDTIFLPRNLPHTWIQTSDRGKLIYILQPALKMEEYFQTMHDLGRPPTQEEENSISLAHGIKMVGPPLSL
ncbi:cupin domain-containing protein [Lunatibacter salilacus]|uniref:cupin domain-containing protein n=1 Tax=Lunatibacter salilacus TaxID=2483804 RepID=UPI00131E0420|nr:cupin domain-containing protein [Lunatibacter salilacus]